MGGCNCIETSSPSEDMLEQNRKNKRTIQTAQNENGICTSFGQNLFKHQAGDSNDKMKQIRELQEQEKGEHTPQSLYTHSQLIAKKQKDNQDNFDFQVNQILQQNFAQQQQNEPQFSNSKENKEPQVQHLGNFTFNQMNNFLFDQFEIIQEKNFDQRIKQFQDIASARSIQEGSVQTKEKSVNFNGSSVVNIEEYREELEEGVADLHQNLNQYISLKQDKVATFQDKSQLTHVIDDFISSSLQSNSIRPRNYTVQKKNSKNTQASFEIQANIIFLRSEEDDESSEVEELRISEISMKQKNQTKVNLIKKTQEPSST